MENQLILITGSAPPAPSTESRAVAFFGKFSTELETIKKANATFVFDLDTKKGREECKSHIFKLQKSRVAIEKAGKAERADSVAYSKAVIAEEDKMTAEIVEMIDFHKKPLEEWETKESSRIENIRIRIDGMKVTAETVMGKTSDELKARLAQIGEIATGIGFDEFADQAYAMKVVAIDQLQAHIAAAEKAEHDARELTRLKAAEEQRLLDEAAAAEAKRIQDELDAAAAAEIARLAEESRQREAAAARRIADAEAENERLAAAQKQAAEDARLDAEAEGAKREAKLLQDAEDARLAQKAAEDRAESDRIAAEERRVADEKAAAQRMADAVAAESKRIADEKAAAQAVDDARAADHAHRAKVNNEVLQTLMGLNESIADAISDVQAKAIITAIALGKIPHLQINY